MKTINATDAKREFGDVLISASKEPVIIEKHHKKYAVVLSFSQYQELINRADLEDTVLGQLAEQAKEGGFLNKEESESLLNKMKNA